MILHDTLEIDDKGLLHIVTRDTSYAEPVIWERWYPTDSFRFFALQDADIGKQVKNLGNGAYQVIDSYRVYRCKDGGQTRPSRADNIPVPAPKTRLETRWHHGHWEKKTAKGWVRA